MPGILAREGQREIRDTETQGRREKARRSEFCTVKQRCMWSHQKLEETRRFSDGAFEESTALLTC